MKVREVYLGDSPEHISYRKDYFDYFQMLFIEQGFCAHQSPASRACTKLAGHNDPLRPGHHAEDRPGHIVEEWL